MDDIRSRACGPAVRTETEERRWGCVAEAVTPNFQLPTPKRWELEVGRWDVDVSQKSICAPSLKNRGVRTDCGASQACEPVVTAGLKFWL